MRYRLAANGAGWAVCCAAQVHLTPQVQASLLAVSKHMHFPTAVIVVRSLFVRLPIVFRLHQSRNVSRNCSSMIWSTSANLEGDLLIDGWAVSNSGQFVITCVVVLVTALAYELLALARPTPAETARVRGLVRDCCVFAVRSFIGYALMLIAMTMNLWLLLFAVLGSALGHGAVMYRTHRRRSSAEAIAVDSGKDGEPLLSNDEEDQHQPE
jgi:hypothetical protein